MSRLDYTSVTIVSAPLTLEQNHNIVLVSNGSTITLPSAASPLFREKVFNIIRTGTSNVLIDTTSSQTISGDLTLTLTNQYDSVAVVSDGSNWVRCS